MITLKIMVFFLVFAILIVLREIFDFVIQLVSNGKYTPGVKRLILAAVAISYIFTIIFTGFKLL